MNRLLLAVASAAVVCAAVSADAAVFTATYRGTVESGFDQTGVFGAPGADLAGLSFTAVYTIDDSTGTNASVPGQYSLTFGNSMSGNVTPVSAVLQINGASHSFSGATYGSATNFSPAFCCGGSVSHLAGENSFDGVQYYLNELNIAIAGYSGFFNPSWDYRAALHYSTKAGDSAGGLFRHQFSDSGTGISYYDYANLTVDSIDIDGVVGPPVGGVPEPAGWALMLSGFGLAGLRLRRRRATVPAT